MENGFGEVPGVPGQCQAFCEKRYPRRMAVPHIGSGVVGGVENGFGEVPGGPRTMPGLL